LQENPAGKNKLYLKIQTGRATQLPQIYKSGESKYVTYLKRAQDYIPG